ncbi:hypothetical protein DEO72_LG7g1338 [Vigna unguiculata]|uniref:Aminotransferase-like n=1 Tax=Vigna unguiculata TaxID=3917 RepID=A0A4D6MHM7_VIGUN|nr:hypothetical protein DEO72_LG7g1338 [Vigna unguiculata]
MVKRKLPNQDENKVEGTPFKWCLQMDRPLNISKPLLMEMLRRWVPEFKGFRVMQHVVPLREVGSLFDGEAVTINTITKKIKSMASSNEVDDVDGVCRNYNWGGAVYTFLINAISRSYEVYVQQQNKYAISIVGAVLVMQLWAVEHLSLCPVERVCCFPRILEWPTLTIRTGKLEFAFQNNQIVWEWSITEEHKRNPILRTALNLREGGVVDEEVDDVQSSPKSPISAKKNGN